MHFLLIVIVIILTAELIRGRDKYIIMDSQTGRVRGVEKKGIGCLGTIVLVLVIMYLLRHV